MRVNNTQNSPNFKSKFFVAGYTDPLIKNPEEAMGEAYRLAAEAGNRIKRYCHQRKIPIFVDEASIEAQEVSIARAFLPDDAINPEEIPHFVVAHSFLTGNDADTFRKSLGGGSMYDPTKMGIPEDRMLDARRILAAMQEHKFDYVEGRFLEEPLAPELRFVEPKPQGRFFTFMQKIPLLGRLFGQ